MGAVSGPEPGEAPVIVAQAPEGPLLAQVHTIGGRHCLRLTRADGTVILDEATIGELRRLLDVWVGGPRCEAPGCGRPLAPMLFGLQRQRGGQSRIWCGPSCRQAAYRARVAAREGRPSRARAFRRGEAL